MYPNFRPANTMSRPHADEYGWTAVPRSRINVPSAQTANLPLRVFHYELPDTAAVQAALTRAKSVLSTQTYNHAMRVYCFALTIVSNQFPSWIAGELKVPFLETLVLAYLFHDLGSRDEIREASYMSFQWLTGTEAMKELHDLKTLPRLQIESVCEAIFKLAILKDKGYTSRVGQLLELATEIGKHMRSSRWSLDVCFHRLEATDHP
jgi:cyanamide hydratase